MKTTSQNEMLRRHLEKGRPITPIQALRNFGIFRLAARIHDLRNEGYVITSEIVEKGGNRFARYKILQ